MALNFIKYVLIEKKVRQATALNKNDSMGKLHELLVGRALNNGKWADHFRSADNGPDKIHDMHARALFGNQYAKSPEYARMVKDADMAANDIKKQYGGKISRVAWTSQAGDYEKETGHKDPNSKADLIITTGSGKNAQKHSLSLKIGKTKSPNYTNPGIDTFEKWAGVPLKQFSDSHRATLSKYGNPNHEAYKAYRDGTDAKGKKIAAEIKASSDGMNRNIAAAMRQAMSSRSHKDLAGIIMQSTNPVTQLPTMVSHILHNRDGSSAHIMHDQSQHIGDYLKEFDNLHVERGGNGISIAIKGTHRKTGKIMPVWQTQVYAGGRPSNNVPRGATTLPSENRIAEYNAREASGGAAPKAKAVAKPVSKPAAKPMTRPAGNLVAAKPVARQVPKKITVKTPTGLPIGGAPTYHYGLGGFNQ